MIIKKIESNFKDTRGMITDILCNQQIDFVTIITNKKGSIRGNHYHKKTIQYLYVLEGSILVASQFEGKELKQKILKEGDLLLNEPYEWHAIKSLEKNKLLILTKGPRGGENYESDTFKLKKPILT